MNIEILPVESIIIGQDRQRQQLDKKHIEELVKTIGEDGLIHAITLSEEGILVAGFCRLVAITTLDKEYRYGTAVIPAGMVPVVRLDARDPLALYKLEFVENARRSNLSPLDNAKALSNLHRMLGAASPEPTAWTKADTAREILKLEGVDPIQRPSAVSGKIEDVGDSLLIESFQNDEDVIAAPSRAAAVKIAKKKLEEQFTQSLGALATVSSTSMEIIHASFADVELIPSSIDGIITDPPYGMDADSFGEQSTVSGHEYDDSQENALAVADSIFNRGFAACREGAHLYMFCDIRLFPDLAKLGRAAGWDVYSTPLIWSKPGIGHAPQVGFYSRRYEAILFAAKGWSRRLQKTAPDLFTFAPVKDKLHAAQKPAELYAEFMRLSFFKGETILDPCAGSGTIFRAAKIAGMQAIGVEKEEKFVNLCKQVIVEGEG